MAQYPYSQARLIQPNGPQIKQPKVNKRTMLRNAAQRRLNKSKASL